MNSFGSMNMFYDAEMAYQRERMQRDFAAINWAAQQRAERRALKADARGAARPATATVPVAGPVRHAWITRLLRTPRPASH